ncbi:hypothetical protein LMTR13_07665 [Bradyrhizobium icense]|uniref:Uncharacterized protein n=1 Tax=Bradyrhizobium icense TaxID=1274631 RepID=A0A1B1UBC8_9BRAD|nr:hypothetical protein LMTR13_07665 [Bradyrhizobium icense]
MECAIEAWRHSIGAVHKEGDDIPQAIDLRSKGFKPTNKIAANRGVCKAVSKSINGKKRDVPSSGILTSNVNVSRRDGLCKQQYFAVIGIVEPCAKYR